MNVLVIDPDQIMSRNICIALKTHGHAVRCCSSAQSGIDAVDANIPDVIVIEPQLGLHNGVEFLYELRSYPEWQDIPVVVYSINRRIADPAFAPALRQLGARDVLYKPTTSLARLAKMVNGYAATAL